jgi:molybdopterin converting factor subunit 1
MTVLYFAQTRRLAGLSSESLPAAGPLTTDQLWTELLNRHPDLAPLRPVTRLARNDDFAPPDAVFQPDDEIALIPPVSGG